MSQKLYVNVAGHEHEVDLPDGFDGPRFVRQVEAAADAPEWIQIRDRHGETINVYSPQVAAYRFVTAPEPQVRRLG